MKKQDKFDVLIVGGGHNGLVAATYLQKAGRSCLLIDANAYLGGAAAEGEIFPGIHGSLGATWSGMLRPSIIRDLELNEFICQPLDPQLYVLSERPSQSFGIYLDPRTTQHSFQSVFKASTQQVLENLNCYQEALKLPTQELEQLAFINNLEARENYWTKISSQVKTFFTLSIGDFLLQHNLPENLSAALAAGALSITNSSPFKKQTAFALAYMNMANTNGLQNCWGIPEESMGSLINVLAERYRAKGGKLILKSPVVSLSNESTFRVDCADGSNYFAKQVLISTHPSVAYKILGLDGPKTQYTYGNCAVVRLLLSKLPKRISEIQAKTKQCAMFVIVPESLELLEQSYSEVATEAKCISISPLMTFSITKVGLQNTQSVSQKFVLQSYIQFVSSSAPADEIYRQVLSKLSERLPDIIENVIDGYALGPKELEKKLALPFGHPEHSTMQFPELLWQRPDTDPWASYRTPINGVFFASAGSVPGGLVTGIPGYNVAKLMLGNK